MMKSKKSSLSWGRILLILMGVALLLTYWYVFVTIGVIVGGIWLYFRHKTKSSSSQNTGNQDYSTPSDNKPESPDSHLVRQSLAKPAVPQQTIEPQRAEPRISRIRRALHDFVVFDIETTGLNSSTDEIIQLSAVKVRHDKIVDTFNAYVKPQQRIPEQITYLTGITNEQVQSASPIDQVILRFSKFAEELPLVGHNIIKFDLPFIIRNGFYREKIEALDTWSLARKADFPDKIKDLKLPTLKRYFGITHISHNAIEDCKTNMVIYQRLRDGKLESTPAPVKVPSHELDKLRFAITGEFIGMSREDLTGLITSHGGRVTKSISKATDFLLDGKQFSDKLTDGIHSHKELVAQEIQRDGGKIRLISVEDLQALITSRL